jgi:NADPH:quinone reductase-like Zn-dependent oxidoreductase
MKAITYQEYGPPEVLRYAEVEKPTIGDDEVLVQVRAASINFGDRAALHGIPRLMRLAFGLRRPKVTILGRDIAGVVSAVGKDVTRFREGDEVVGEMEQGGFAEYVAAPEKHLAAVPAGVTFEQAATLPVAGTTAVQALRLGEVEPGSTVLVNGASGGVGTFTVQVAKTLGAEVTAACGTRNADLMRSIGADHVIDYTHDDVTRGAGRYDVIVDLAGDHRLSELRRVLTPNGVYVSSTGSGGQLVGPLPRLFGVMVTSPFVGHRLRVLAAKRDIADLTHLAELVASGKVTPVIERTYALSETADAIRFIEAEHARGKIVLTTG